MSVIASTSPPLARHPHPPDGPPGALVSVQTGRPDTRLMLLMGMMMAGACSVDAITANLLPITAKHFTGNLTFIAFLVALNRISGFLVQPYAAWKGDAHAGPGGRRRPFLLVAWPATLGFLGLLGALPFLVPPEYQFTTVAVALLLVINLGLQVSLDVCYGSGIPMYGDLFPSGTIGRANAIRSLLGSAILVVMMSVAVPLADRHEFLPYLVAIGFVTISWGIARFAIREPSPVQRAPRRRYHPLLPLKELRHPQTRAVAFIASAVLAALAVTELFNVLFVTETLGLSMSALGWSVAAGIIVSILCPYPAGQIVDRFGPRSILIAGFALLVAVEAAFVFWVDDAWSLCVVFVLFKVAAVSLKVPIEPLMFRDTPEDRRGSMFAGVQMTRAGVASAATILAGYAAHQADSYRTCYVIAGLIGIAGLAGACRLVRTGTPAASRNSPAA